MAIHGSPKPPIIHKGTIHNVTFPVPDGPNKWIYVACTSIGMVYEGQEASKHIMWADTWEETTCRLCLKYKPQPFTRKDAHIILATLVNAITNSRGRMISSSDPSWKNAEKYLADVT